MDFERLHGVFRAAGMESTMLAKQWADEAFVETQQRDQYPTHECAYLYRNHDIRIRIIAGWQG